MGFSNSGLDCYWSSALVTMLHMPPLLQWLSSHEQSHCAAGVDTSECPACLLRFICKMYWSVDKKDSQEELDRLGTRLWKSCLKIFWREQTREQQDASLFLTTFIRYLIDEFDIPERYEQFKPLRSKLFDLCIKTAIVTTNYFRTCS